MSYYLSQVQLDTHNRQKLSDLTHLGRYHGWIQSCFPQVPDGTPRPRNLWRIDHVHGRDYLLLMSPEKPDIRTLEKYGVHGTARTKTYDHFISNLATNGLYRFRLVANPVHCVGDKVYPHVTIDQQKQWLIDRQARNGFRLLSFDLTSRSYKPLIHEPRKTPIKLSQAAFEGVLQITDMNAFKSMLTQGIGHERAYGMGLMTVMPLQK